MKQFLPITAVLVASVVAIPSITRAEEQPPAGKPPGEAGKHGPRPEGPAERLKYMTERLGLTAEQQEKIRAIFEKNAGLMKEMMAKGRENVTEEDKAKFREAMKAQKEEIMAVLTPEQKEKMREHMEKRPGGPGGPGGPERPGGPNGNKVHGEGRPGKAPDAGEVRN